MWWKSDYSVNVFIWVSFFLRIVISVSSVMLQRKYNSRCGRLFFFASFSFMWVKKPKICYKKVLLHIDDDSYVSIYSFTSILYVGKNQSLVIRRHCIWIMIHMSVNTFFLLFCMLVFLSTKKLLFCSFCMTRIQIHTM
jgi:hypothetical protein